MFGEKVNVCTIVFSEYGINALYDLIKVMIESEISLPVFGTVFKEDGIWKD
jgi:hypothetical protein